MSSGNFQKAFLNNFTIFITLKGNKIILHHCSPNSPSTLIGGEGEDELKWIRV